jgi:hypothetical protein
VNGLRLAEMEVSEMLDVIHYFFEEDYRYTSTEQANFKDSFRETIYKSLYEIDYEYKSNNDEDRRSYKNFDTDIEDPLDSEDDPVEIIEPFNPRVKQIKNFIEPTIPQENSLKPFGSILDEPLA